MSVKRTSETSNYTIDTVFDPIIPDKQVVIPMSEDIVVEEFEDSVLIRPKDFLNLPVLKERLDYVDIPTCLTYAKSWGDNDVFIRLKNDYIFNGYCMRYRINLDADGSTAMEVIAQFFKVSK